MMNGMGFGGMGLSWLLWIAIIGLVIWAVIKRVGGGTLTTGAQTNDALAILKSRYAKGELDRQEYERMKKDLQ